MSTKTAESPVWKRPYTLPPRPPKRKNGNGSNGQQDKRLIRFMLCIKTLPDIDGPLYLDLVSEALQLSIDEIVSLVEDCRRHGRALSLEKDQTGRPFILIY
jgi:hypothetical protein